MRFYQRQEADIMFSINRCLFDAQHSRVSLALERFRDLKDEFPKDADIAYHEGLLRKDYLGQGVAAQKLFKKAYELDNTHAFAACNAAVFAPNEQQFRKWADVSLKLAPNDHSHRQFVTEFLSHLEQGIPYWQLLIVATEQY